MFRHPLVSLLLLPLLAAEVSAQGGPKPNAPLKAEVYQVNPEPFVQKISTVGTLRANESVTLVSELSRRLVKVHVEEGSEVKAGDVLFKLDDSDLKAELAQIAARLELAEINKRRAESLTPQKAISQQESDSAINAVHLLLAQLRTQEVQLAKTEIRAPFSGRVGVRQLSEGAFVTPQTPLITLQDVSRIKVDFPLPERYATEVKPGQKFTFTVAGSGTIYEGAVTVLEPSIDVPTRSLAVRGLCSSPQGLHPGGFAEVTLSLDKLANGFMVPSQAIVPSPRGQGLWVIEDGKAKLQQVEIGIRTEDKVQILRGVKEGDVVITSNLLRVRTGLEVTPVQAP